MQHAFPENKESNKVILSISHNGFQKSIWLKNPYFNFHILTPFDIKKKPLNIWRQQGCVEQIHMFHDNSQITKSFTTNKKLMTGQKGKKVTSSSPAEIRTQLCRFMESDTMEFLSL